MNTETITQQIAEALGYTKFHDDKAEAVQRVLDMYLLDPEYHAKSYYYKLGYEQGRNDALQ